MSRFHILVEQGEDAGKQLTVPEEGARVGRSSENDIVLVDPLLSRHHCRLFFKDGGLWVTDLGSANETIVNGNTIVETAVHRGDRITIGDTVLQIVDDGRVTAAPAVSAGPVDLGFSDTPGTKPNAKRIGLGPLITILCIVVAGALGAYIVKSMNQPLPDPIPVVTEEPQADMPLTVDYEKVEASADNIFHYHFTLSPEGVLAITIDDLQNNRSVTSDRKKVKPELIEDLAEYLSQSGFFSLEDRYQGVAPSVLDQRTITITIGKDTHSCQLVNRSEPDIFAMVREKLEDFGRVELGLWAVQFSTEKLLQMANDAYLLGKKLYAERMIALGNLSEAISSFKEAAWYLETVEVKPDYYADILASRRTCEEALNQNYEEQSFRAERAIRLREWATAAAELRILLELIPDREDERHIEARKELLEVDARMEAMKR